MDEFMSVLTEANGTNEKQLIKEHLKGVVPQDVYDKWIEYFVVEEIDDEQITIGYYGKASLRKFEKKYKKMVWLEICSFIGCVKKLNIYKRKQQPSDVFAENDIENYVDEPINEVVIKSAEHKVVDDSEDFLKIISKKPLRLIRALIVFAIIAGLLSVVTLVGVNYVSNQSFLETFYNVGSIKANEKIRIIQISDLHSSTYGEDNSFLIERIEKLNPDIIIYTGDCIELNEASVNATVKLCSELSEVAPSYYVYGNKEVDLVYGFPLTKGELDERFGFDDDNRKPEKLFRLEDAFEEKLEKTGVTVLKNEKKTIKVGTTNVDIYGSLTSNPSAFWPYGGESFSDFIYSDTDNLKVFAIHEPFVFENYLSESWGDIMLCGHTHGGMIRVPLLGPLYTREGGLLPEKKDCFVSGRYNIDGRPLIVSAGLENSSFLRINNKPELSIIDINRF